ncbi:polyadenylate-binding protein-interacting protein 5-like [Malus sylvestris]|uniref:polyadenylate-binding protein-interacting protein 5 n=1 Tax=Malus domestica TaxID=3750 RepID=UPI0010AB0562|nr:polyadenylate-binding protein-interacting protein 5 [Malus domestica]XP_028950995.1 polyadenylate-binding protein-interacting protein 5 [Malus domestica]XP_050127582.1 polyadenylate-binding protein-interacting protein 5-like [Malus sylvestris]XP_050127583.1 polyadenylate-binding protein-interacting protein 5-like [Malus sylvestris]
MKPGLSSLNPYAAAYIPISKRETDDRTFVTTKDSSHSNESVWFGNPQNFTQNQHHSKAYLQSDAPGTATLQSPKSYAVKSYPAHDSYGSFSQNMNKVSENEDFDMDMEFLGLSFPGISDQSLSDVYLANRGDLDATIDMLNQLEFCVVESSEGLPDTLDIGDVSESGLAGNSAWKPKNVAGEASGSPKS